MNGRFRGLTWDHPRGRDALVAAARRLDPAVLVLDWDTQPLEGFESHPVDDLCARYDLIVLDHPHLGEALGTGCLTPLDDLFDAAELASWRAATIGPSMRSYHLAGRQWALPLDAATQVSAARTDLIGPPPETWDEVAALCRERPVALSLAGPHAFLSFASIAVSLGEEPAATPDRLLSPGVGRAVLDVMATVDGHAPAQTRALNPIGLLELMSHTDRLGLCPLVYGYVTYAGRVTFTDAPSATAGGRPGSTLGGTGIAVSARCAPTPALLDHIRWLMSPDAQRRFVPEHAGQPSARAAWADEPVNRASGDFYRRTARSCENAWVRPRYAGYISFQNAASALIRAVLSGELGHRRGLDLLDERYRAGHTEREHHP